MIESSTHTTVFKILKKILVPRKERKYYLLEN